MKGIIRARGSGTHLYPAIFVVNKQWPASSKGFGKLHFEFESALFYVFDR